MRKLAVTPVNAADGQLGYLGSIVVEGHRVWAVGGTFHKPTLLYSDDRGHSFVRWRTPPGVPGLRDLHVAGDRVWVVGEWGAVAHTTDAGENWTKLKPIVGTSCLYSIMPDAQDRLWILGDQGLVMRIKPQGKRFTKVDNESTGRLLYMFVEGEDIWLLDDGGMLQRNRGRGFAEVPLAAMRTKRPLCALVRTAARTLLLLGDGGLVLRSTNDGTAWKKISVESRNDLEKILVTPYGIFVVGDHGSLLVSHDDGRSFQGLSVKFGDAHLWSLAMIDGDMIIGGERGQLWRIEKADLAGLLHAVFQKRDPVIAGLAASLRDGIEGADLVLEDALKERELL